MLRLDLKIGFACNNRCAFCAQGDKRRVLPRRSLDDILRELQIASEKGVSGVVFTGGEPTLHPDLPTAASRARDLGFQTIQVQTNGRRCAYPEYCRTLKEAGVTEVSPSVHGSQASIHDRATGAAGAWQQVVSGIRNLKALGIKVLTNSVVTSENYRDIPQLARLLVHLRVDQFQFAFVHIVGTAEENASWIVPRKSEVSPFLLEALRIGRAAGLPCYTEAVPHCLLTGFEDCAAERLIPDGPVIDAGFQLESWQAYRVDKGKAKRADCRRCRYDAACEGPWKEYPEIHGWDEFVPVP